MSGEPDFSMRTVVQDLLNELDADCVLLGADVTMRSAGIWRADTIQAPVLIRPRSTAEVSTALRICHAHNQSVVPQGGLTGLVEGGLTTIQDVVLSFERMNQIEAINTLERTAVVQSGVILQTLQEAVAEVGLNFPLDLGGRGSCTIGGNISTNAGGNRVIRFGMMRDMVLGLEAVLADGTVVSSMNQMIKNNAGYDLKQLFIGTEGTLGVVTRAVLRCREEVVSQPTALVAVDTFQNLTRFLKHADRELRGSLSAFEVMWQNYYQLVTTSPAKNQAPLPDNSAYYVLVEAMGADESLMQDMLAGALDAALISDAVIAQSDVQRLQIWALRDDVEQTFQFGPTFLFDVSLRIPKMADYVAEVNRRLKTALPAARNFVLGHMGDGNLHFAVSAGDDHQDTRRLVESCIYEPLAAIGGSVSAEHGIGLEKKPYLSIARNGPEIALMKTLKRALDPTSILNPGKVFE